MADDSRTPDHILAEAAAWSSCGRRPVVGQGRSFREFSLASRGKLELEFFNGTLDQRIVLKFFANLSCRL